MLTCSTCRGADFDETDEGFYVCHRCGTQSQDVIREVEDEELAFNTAGQGKVHGARRLKTPSAKQGGGAGRDGTYGGTPGGPGVGRDGTTDGFRDRGGVATTSSNDQKIESPSEPALERFAAYCDGVQALLRKQVGVLVTEFHFDSGIVETAHALWVSFLDNSGVLSADFGDEQTFRKGFGNKPTGKESDESDDDRDDSGKESSDDDDTDDDSGDSDTDFSTQRNRRREKALRRVAKQTLVKKKAKKKTVTFRAWAVCAVPPRVTVAICYLACLIHRAPVHLGDFHGWARDGRFPWIRESVAVAVTCARREEELLRKFSFAPSKKETESALQKASRERFAAPLATALVQSGVPKIHLLEASTRRVVFYLHTGTKQTLVPPLNASAFLDRWCCAFFPDSQPFRKRAKRALCLYQAPGYRHAWQSSKCGEDASVDGDETPNTRGVSAPAHAHAAALLLATMKSSFGLTDECVWDWRRWVSFVERFGTGGTVGTHPGTADPEDACYENRETQTKQSADSFIAYCRDHVLAGRVVDPPRDRVVANLWRAYETLPLGGKKNNPPPPGIEPVRAVTSNAGNAPVPNTYAGNAPWLNTYNAHTPTPLDLPTGNHAYWAGPVALQDAPSPYRACVCALALKTFVAPTVLHACVRQVDFAFTARERFLEKEFVEFKKRALIERKETRARLGKKPMGKRSKK